MILASVPGHPSSLHLQTPRNTIFWRKKKSGSRPSRRGKYGQKNPGSPGLFPLFFKLFLQISESHLNYHHRVCQIPGAKFPSKLVEFCSSCRGFNDGVNGTVMGCHQEVTTNGRWWCRKYFEKNRPKKRALLFWKKTRRHIFFWPLKISITWETRSHRSSFGKKWDVCVKPNISWCWLRFGNHDPTDSPSICHAWHVAGTRFMIDFLCFGGGSLEVPIRKLTWNLKMIVFSRNLLFQGFIFRFYVSFRGCNSCGKTESWSHGKTPSLRPFVERGQKDCTSDTTGL